MIAITETVINRTNKALNAVLVSEVPITIKHPSETAIKTISMIADIIIPSKYFDVIQTDEKIHLSAFRFHL